IFYTLPPIELITAFLLVIPKWRLRGLYLSLLMMATFTAYIAIVMTGIFGRIPCTCGGVVSKLTWSQHLIFNLTFLSISVLAAYLCNHSPPHIPKHKVNLQK
ncbi:MauE/DoxX family redox-associated membrane protein, partial [Belliella marina]